MVDAYATHLSERSYRDLRAYAHSLWVGLVEVSAHGWLIVPSNSHSIDP